MSYHSIRPFGIGSIQNHFLFIIALYFFSPTLPSPCPLGVALYSQYGFRSKSYYMAESLPSVASVQPANDRTLFLFIDCIYQIDPFLLILNPHSGYNPHLFWNVWIANVLWHRNLCELKERVRRQRQGLNYTRIEFLLTFFSSFIVWLENDGQIRFYYYYIRKFLYALSSWYYIATLAVAPLIRHTPTPGAIHIGWMGRRQQHQFNTF